MQPRGIHHLGVAVENLDDALGTYERLFDARIEGRETLDGQGVEAAALRVGDSRVELVAALGDDTPVGRFLSKRGPGMHHVAYGVDDLADALEELAGKGAEVIDDKPHAGLYGPAAFIHPESVHGVLVELVGSG
jgi:methylmalonyl-CoA/ethylmalonyl-CoA epimerase